VNAPGGEGNPGTVLTSTQTSARTLATLAALGLLLTSCAGGLGSGAGLAGLPPGTTAIRVTNHVAAPGELDRITITVDGEPVALSSIPPQGAEAAVIARLRLRPGGHTIAVRAKGHGPGSEVIVVGTQQPFHVGAAPAAITIDVSSGAGDATASSPVAVSLAIQGGRMAPEFGVAPADDKDERCAGLLTIPRAICRAAVDLDEAGRKNDIVAALCVRDKLVEMRRLAIIGESSRGDAVAMAEAEVTTLSHQVELCGGEVTAPRPDGVTVTPPSRRQ
jgi:hypothetical protein